jgi:hypothetical protein
MSGPFRRTPLPNFAAIVSILDLTERKLLGGYKVPMFPFLTQGLLLLWEGAALARTRADKISLIVKTLIGSEAIAVALQNFGTSYEVALDRANQEDWVLAYVEKVAPDGLRYYGRQPESLLDLFATSFAPPEVDFRDIKNLKRLKKQSLAHEQAALQGSGWFVVGISLGYKEPDLARALCTNPYGARDHLWWSEYKKAGGVGPPAPEELTAVAVDEAAEMLAVGTAATYADQHYPEIKAPLRLNT